MLLKVKLFVGDTEIIGGGYQIPIEDNYNDRYIDELANWIENTVDVLREKRRALKQFSDEDLKIELEGRGWTFEK